jgi:hypothetical protein
VGTSLGVSFQKVPISEINLFSPRSDMLNWFLPQDIVKILVTGIFDVGIFNK